MSLPSTSYREVIFHLTTQGKSAKQIHQELIETYGQDAPHYSTVTRWVNEHRRGRRDVTNRPSTGRPPEAILPSKIDAARRIVASDPKISCYALAPMLILSRATTKIILEQHLGLKKLLARWVPHSLTQAQRDARREWGQYFLDNYAGQWTRFKNRYVTMDETWVFFGSPPTRESCAEWRPAGSAAPEVPRLATDRRKLMAIVFWDSKGIVHLEWFKTSKHRPGVDKDYYESVIDRFFASAQKNRPQKVSQRILLHQDGAPCHWAPNVKRKMHQLRIEVMHHPPYSPDLAPSDYILFRDLKNFMKSAPTKSETEMQSKVASYFASKTQSYYERAIDKLREKAEAVIESNGCYLQE